MAREVPGSVTNSVRMLGLIVATAGVITLLTWWMRQTEVIIGWAEGNPSAHGDDDEGDGDGDGDGDGLGHWVPCGGFSWWNPATRVAVVAGGGRLPARRCRCR